MYRLVGPIIVKTFHCGAIAFPQAADKSKPAFSVNFLCRVTPRHLHLSCKVFGTRTADESHAIYSTPKYATNILPAGDRKPPLNLAQDLNHFFPGVLQDRAALCLPKL